VRISLLHPSAEAGAAENDLLAIAVDEFSAGDSDESVWAHVEEGVGEIAGYVVVALRADEPRYILIGLAVRPAERDDRQPRIRRTVA
jgi:hypothetical protein